MKINKTLLQFHELYSFKRANPHDLQENFIYNLEIDGWDKIDVYRCLSYNSDENF